MLGDNWSSRQLRKALTEEYPYLLPRKMTTGEVHSDYDYQFIVGEYDLPEGWMELFLQCCEDLKEPLVKADYLDKFRFSELKEKYGSMRMYTFTAPAEVQDILSKYEFLSAQVCCECGKPAVAMTTDWICPYCEEHVPGGIENVVSDELIKIKTQYTRSCWSSEGVTEAIIDCSEEWQRYLKRISYNENAG